MRFTVEFPNNDGPVPYANVLLNKPTDSLKLIAGTVTDTLGRFTLSGIPEGQYSLSVLQVGSKKSISLVDVRNGTTTEVGTIILETDVTLLSGVEVTAQRNVIEKTEAGFVFNANTSITQVGGTAADLLRNMPGVLVDADGTITIRGRSPLILINGRTSGIAGVDRVAQLDRISAPSIERVDVNNNPSANYDADAEGGVINIVLKKGDLRGTNGAFAAGVGHGDNFRYNVSALINHRREKWNLGTAYDNWYTTRTRKVSGDRISRFPINIILLKDVMMND